MVSSCPDTVNTQLNLLHLVKIGIRNLIAIPLCWKRAWLFTLLLHPVQAFVIISAFSFLSHSVPLSLPPFISLSLLLRPAMSPIMLRLGQFKAIAVLLLALCLLASLTYIKVWSTINTNAEDDIRREKGAKSSQYQPKHSNVSNQFIGSIVHAEIVGVLHTIYRSNAHPLFWERPLRGWIVNYSAILEPCDRTKHTSAHCLSYLTQDHLYLVPSRQARAFPNRRYTVVSDSVVRPEDMELEQPVGQNHDENAMPEDMELEQSVGQNHDENAMPEDMELEQSVGQNHDENAVPEDMELEQSVGQNHDENAMPESFTAPTTATPAMMHFHIFWRGVITDKLSLASHAFLFTQPLDRARLHLWIDSTDLPGGQPEDYSQNTFAKDLVSPPLNRFVKIHMWDQGEQETYAYPALMTDLDSNNRDGQQQGQEQGGPNATAVVPPVALSDEARFLILYRYGGMYLDADVLLLRDMSPLYDSGMEFAYEWSYTQQYNTAVLRLNRGGEVARRVLDGAKAKEKEIQERQMGKEETTVMQGKKPDDKSGEKELKAMQEGSNSKKRTRGRPKQQEERPSKASSIEPHVVEDSEGEDSLGHSNGDSLFASDTAIASITPHRLTMRKEMRPDEIYHPARLRQYLDPQNGTIANNGLVMMPTAIFDPLWLRVDHAESTSGLENDKEKMMEDLKTFPEAFANKDQDFIAGPEVFFRGAYAYHWHNNWLTPIAEQSWMGVMHKAYTEFLAGERPNLYGEWFQGDSEIPFTKW